MTIHELNRQELEYLLKQIENLPDGSEEQKRLVDECAALYKATLEHEKIDEEVNDRRYKMELDKEKAEKELERDHVKIKSERTMTILKVLALLLSFGLGVAAENKGMLVPNGLNDFKRKL